MDRGKRRKLRKRKIMRRKKLYKSLNSSRYPNNIIPKDGYFENGSLLNAEGGLSKKTNWKKRHSNYRRKGGYGKGMDYKPHDQRQIDRLSDQEI